MYYNSMRIIINVRLRTLTIKINIRENFDKFIIIMLNSN